MMRISRHCLLLLPLVAGCGPEEPVEQPTPLTQDAPIDYPVVLWDEGIEGETLLMVHVTAHGDVDSTYVERSSGYPEFDSAAVAGVRALRFAPGRRGDRRVDVWARLPVKFTREGGAAVTVAAPETRP